MVQRGAPTVQELVSDGDTVNLQRAVHYWGVQGGIPHRFTYDPAAGDVDGLDRVLLVEDTLACEPPVTIKSQLQPGGEQSEHEP